MRSLQISISGPLTDTDICAALLLHLSLDASPSFRAAPSNAANSSTGKPPSTVPQRSATTAPSSTARTAGSSHPGEQVLDLEQFLARTHQLLELERAAEVAQATEATQLVSPETAQVGHPIVSQLLVRTVK